MRKFYYIALFFYFSVVFLHISSSYEAEKVKIYSDIDNRLERYAKLADYLLIEKLHTNSMDKDTISEDDDRHNREILSAMVDDFKITYIYSLIEQNGKIYFSSSSASQKDYNSALVTHYFDEYEEASNILKNSFINKEISFEESKDRWGEFRSIFLPRITKDGFVYVVGVDTDRAYIDNILKETLFHYVIEFFVYLIAITPLFYIYYRHNYLIQSTLENSVNIKTKEIKYKTIQMRYILDNVNQGFLSIDRELTVLDEYSKKCYEIFNSGISGKNILNLLFKDSDIDLIEEIFYAIFDESDSVKIDALVSMLPSELILNNINLSIEYKREKNIIVLILTDITEEVKLAKKLELEHKIMRMVVGVVANSEEFYALIDDYELFLSSRLDMIDESKTPLENIKNLYRNIHTFKGIFLQKDFITTPKALHKLEDELSSWIDRDDITNEKIKKYIASVDFNLWLSRDLDNIISLLGSEFVENSKNLLINKELFVRLYNQISSLNRSAELSSELSELQDMMKVHMYKKMQDCFVSFDRLLEQLCEKTDKKISPLKITDNTTTLVDNSIRSFIKSLHHVIQNSVIHGIESSEDRILLDKDKYGKIEVELFENIDDFIIEISDDGRGLDFDLIYHKALECDMMVDREDDYRLAELIFSDFFSTKEVVSTLSGRGVGLAAVRSELEKLGGRYEIKTKANSGTRFIFYIPKKSLNIYNKVEYVKSVDSR